MILQGIVSFVYLVYGIYLCCASVKSYEKEEEDDDEIILEEESEYEEESAYEEDDQEYNIPNERDIRPPAYEYQPLPSAISENDREEEFQQLWNSCLLEHKYDQIKDTIPNLSKSSWKKRIQQRLYEVYNNENYKANAWNFIKNNRLRTNRCLLKIEDTVLDMLEYDQLRRASD